MCTATQNKSVLWFSLTQSRQFIIFIECKGQVRCLYGLQFERQDVLFVCITTPLLHISIISTCTCLHTHTNMYAHAAYRIAGKFGGGKFGELTGFEHLAKETVTNYGSVNRLLVVSTNLNGFSW